MTGEKTKVFGKFFGRFKESIEKISDSVISSPDDMDLILAVIQRIDMDGEQATGTTPASTPEPDDEETVYQKLMKRLHWQLLKSGISADEAIRNFPGEVHAVLLYRSYDKFKGAESNLLREKFIEMGWKNIQPNLWVLPPNRTPAGSVSSGELKVWLRKKLVKPFGKEFDYVFPVAAVIDMKQLTADKKGIRKMPTARTIYNVLDPSEVVPASHLYSVMKSRGYGVRDVILSGNVPFLASAFASPDELMAIQENEDAIAASLKQMTGSQSINLQDIANLGPDLLADAFGSTVVHGRDLAQRLIVEAQFWMRQLGGSVPAPSAPAPIAQPGAERVEPVQRPKEWGERVEEAKEEEKAASSQESWYEPGEKSGEETVDEQSETGEEAVAEAKVPDEGPES